MALRKKHNTKRRCLNCDRAFTTTEDYRMCFNCRQKANDASRYYGDFEVRMAPQRRPSRENP